MAEHIVDCREVPAEEWTSEHEALAQSELLAALPRAFDWETCAVHH
jgi:hypothetical protein